MKHTRRQLLAYIAEIQNQIGLALEYNDNDQAERAPRVRKALARAHDLCITAQATDKPASLAEQSAVRGFRIETAGVPLARHYGEAGRRHVCTRAPRCEATAHHDECPLKPDPADTDH